MSGFIILFSGPLYEEPAEARYLVPNNMYKPFFFDTDAAANYARMFVPVCFSGHFTIRQVSISTIFYEQLFHMKVLFV